MYDKRTEGFSASAVDMEMPVKAVFQYRRTSVAEMKKTGQAKQPL